MSAESVPGRHGLRSWTAASTASPLRVVLAGRPGAGKGVQGVRLARRLGVQYLSTGDLLRREIMLQSPLGRAVDRLVVAGRLVPTGLIMAILDTNLDGRGYLLDGVPRTVAQAKTLLAHAARAPTVAIEIVVAENVALGRLMARGRHDDDPAVARDRLAVYNEQTVPALEWLDRLRRLVRVDGHDSPDVVERRMWRALRDFGRACGGSLSDAFGTGNARGSSRSAEVGGVP